MAVAIRLSRQGTKKRPFYRVVVTDSRSPRGGKFLENIGTFDPAKEMKDSSLKIDQERLAYWRGTGATPSADAHQAPQGAAARSKPPPRRAK